MNFKVTEAIDFLSPIGRIKMHTSLLDYNLSAVITDYVSQPIWWARFDIKKWSVRCCVGESYFFREVPCVKLWRLLFILVYIIGCQLFDLYGVSEPVVLLQLAYTSMMSNGGSQNRNYSAASLLFGEEKTWMGNMSNENEPFTDGNSSEIKNKDLCGGFLKIFFFFFTPPLVWWNELTCS